MERQAQVFSGVMNVCLVFMADLMKGIVGRYEVG